MRAALSLGSKNSPPDCFLYGLTVLEEIIKNAQPKLSIFVFDQRSKLTLLVLKVAFDIVNRVIILLASYATCVAVLRTSFCFSQNARRAICTQSLTSELVDSRRLIIVLDRLG